MWSNPEGALVHLMFGSTHDVIKAERILREQGLELRVVFLPRRLTHECAMGIQLAGKDVLKAGPLLAGRGVSVRFEGDRAVVGDGAVGGDGNEDAGR
jgi:hypothetical protein